MAMARPIKRTRSGITTGKPLVTARSPKRETGSSMEAWPRRGDVTARKMTAKQGKRKSGVGENGEQKHDEKAEGKRAKARGSGVAGAVEEARGENCVTHDIEDQDLARQVRSAGKPLGRGIKEVKIGGDGDDGDLGKVENAEPIPAAGFFVGGGEKHHENRGRPDEEEDVRGDRHVRGAGNKSLVIGSDGLGESFEEKSDGKEGPKLASVSLGAASGVGGGQRRKEDHEEIEGVGI